MWLMLRWVTVSPMTPPLSERGSKRDSTSLEGEGLKGGRSPPLKMNFNHLTTILLQKHMELKTKEGFLRLACVAYSRFGENSPVRILVSDPYLFRYFVEEKPQRRFPETYKEICQQIRIDMKWLSCNSEIRSQFLAYENTIKRDRKQARFRNDQAYIWLRNFWMTLFRIKTHPQDILYVNSWTKAEIR